MLTGFAMFIPSVGLLCGSSEMFESARGSQNENTPFHPVLLRDLQGGGFRSHKELPREYDYVCSEWDLFNHESRGEVTNCHTEITFNAGEDKLGLASE